MGTAVAQWLRCCATIQKVAGSIPAGVIGFFIDIKSFRSHYGPGVDSVSNRNEYQEYFLGVKAPGAFGWQPYHHPVPLSRKSGNLNFLEPSGPVQACNGTALPLKVHFGGLGYTTINKFHSRSGGLYLALYEANQTSKFQDAKWHLCQTEDTQSPGYLKTEPAK